MLPLRSKSAKEQESRGIRKGNTMNLQIKHLFIFIIFFQQLASAQYFFNVKTGDNFEYFTTSSGYVFDYGSINTYKEFLNIDSSAQSAEESKYFYTRTLIQTSIKRWYLSPDSITYFSDSADTLQKVNGCYFSNTSHFVAIEEDTIFKIVSNPQKLDTFFLFDPCSFVYQSSGCASKEFFFLSIMIQAFLLPGKI